MNSIAVLGRGKSLSYFNMIPKVDTYVLVNEMAREIEHNNLHDKLKGKNVIHLVNRSPQPSKEMIEAGYYKSLDVKEIWVNCYEKDMIPNKYVNSNTNRRWSVKNIPVHFLSGKIQQEVTNVFPADEHTNWSIGNTGIPSCGMAALVYSAVEHGVSDVYTVGIDFYEVDYSLGIENIPERASMEDARRAEKPHIMKKFLTDLAEHYPNTNFHICTYGDYNSTLKNVNVFKIGGSK